MKKNKVFTITDTQISPPQPPKITHVFAVANVRRSSPPRRATRNFVVMEARHLLQLPTPRAKRNFIITDNSPPLHPPKPRARRKRAVKTYKLNKNISYRRGLHILKKITEED